MQLTFQVRTIIEMAQLMHNVSCETTTVAMTCSNFYQLTYAQQADILLNQGTLLGTRLDGNFVIDLFELQNLLIEIFYHRDNEDPLSVMAYDANDKLEILQKDTLRPRLTINNRTRPFQKGNFAA